tara:strand:- start:675 stop:1436 length:762 start_codon:yes stop_codon:yes gene_type:complete
MQKVKILKGYVNSISLKELKKNLVNTINNNKNGYVCVSSVHSNIEAYKNSEFKNAYNSADFVLPDGRPLYWVLKILGYKDTEHLRGEFVTRNLIDLAAENNFAIGFFGGRKDSLNKCVINLQKKHPKLKIPFKYTLNDYEFKNILSENNESILDQINSSNIKVLFVGLGCPKQELWMHKNKNKLKCICIGIGAAIDFISGDKYSAPLWIQKIGLEWFIRLITEPKRLFWRYLTTNILFIILIFLQLTGLKKFE